MDAGITNWSNVELGLHLRISSPSHLPCKTRRRRRREKREAVGDGDAYLLDDAGIADEGDVELGLELLSQAEQDGKVALSQR